MKYYTSNLLRKINSGNIIERNLAENQWDKNCQSYDNYFNLIKEKLPQRFIKAFYKYHGFHDFVIKNISILNGKKVKGSKVSIILVIENHESSFTIKYVGVTKFLINIADINNCMCGDINWWYSEFEMTDSELFRQNILCDFDSEVEIEFKKLVFKNISG